MTFILYAIKAVVGIVLGFLFLVAAVQTATNYFDLLRYRRLTFAGDDQDELPAEVLHWGRDTKRIVSFLAKHLFVTLGLGLAFIALLML